jgi:pantoate--beta-alanine ligase
VKNLNKRVALRLFKPDVSSETSCPMQKIESVSEMRSLAAEMKIQGKTVALVATQGALHAGQEALIRAAVESAQVVIVSVFVNPLQFGPNEVIANYPRSLEQDIALCERCGAHIVFAHRTATVHQRHRAHQYATEAKTALARLLFKQRGLNRMRVFQSAHAFRRGDVFTRQRL